jgi:hypothetical protein
MVTATPPTPTTGTAELEALRKENMSLKARIAELEATLEKHKAATPCSGVARRLPLSSSEMSELRVEAVSRPCSAMAVTTVAVDEPSTVAMHDEELGRWASLVRLRDQQLKEKS